MVPNGSLNSSSTTCGTTLAITCDPCYDMVGNGLAACGHYETWEFASECKPTIKGSCLRNSRNVIGCNITSTYMMFTLFFLFKLYW